MFSDIIIKKIVTVRKIKMAYEVSKLFNDLDV